MSLNSQISDIYCSVNEPNENVPAERLDDVLKNIQRYAIKSLLGETELKKDNTNGQETGDHKNKSNNEKDEKMEDIKNVYSNDMIKLKKQQLILSELHKNIKKFKKYKETVEMKESVLVRQKLIRKNSHLNELKDCLDALTSLNNEDGKIDVSFSDHSLKSSKSSGQPCMRTKKHQSSTNRKITRIIHSSSSSSESDKELADDPPTRHRKGNSGRFKIYKYDKSTKRSSGLFFERSYKKEVRNMAKSCYDLRDRIMQLKGKIDSMKFNLDLEKIKLEEDKDVVKPPSMLDINEDMLFNSTNSFPDLSLIKLIQGKKANKHNKNKFTEVTTNNPKYVEQFDKFQTLSKEELKKIVEEQKLLNIAQNEESLMLHRMYMQDMKLKWSARAKEYRERLTAIDALCNNELQNLKEKKSQINHLMTSVKSDYFGDVYNYYNKKTLPDPQDTYDYPQDKTIALNQGEYDFLEDNSNSLNDEPFDFHRDKTNMMNQGASDYLKEKPNSLSCEEPDFFQDKPVSRHQKRITEPLSKHISQTSFYKISSGLPCPPSYAEIFKRPYSTSETTDTKTISFLEKIDNYSKLLSESKIEPFFPKSKSAISNSGKNIYGDEGIMPYPTAALDYVLRTGVSCSREKTELCLTDFTKKGKRMSSFTDDSLAQIQNSLKQFPMYSHSMFH